MQNDEGREAARIQRRVVFQRAGHDLEPDVAVAKRPGADAGGLDLQQSGVEERGGRGDGGDLHGVLDQRHAASPPELARGLGQHRGSRDAFMTDRKSTRLNSSHHTTKYVSRMPSSA
jgi:hypothetical protein